MTSDSPLRLSAEDLRGSPVYACVVEVVERALGYLLAW